MAANHTANHTGTEARMWEKELSVLTVVPPCVTLCHMKAISLRELHERTGEWVRKVGQLGEIQVTDRGQPIAKIVPQTREPEVPYFARRKLTPAFRKLMASGKLRGGTDSTTVVSEDRDRPDE
jgi:antitoxin (DNA-binding transcriptional repressor) of toxin-antitoxin stability system